MCFIRLRFLNKIAEDRWVVSKRATNRQQEVLRYGGIEHGLSCGIIVELLNNLPGDIITDYRHIAKPWPLAAINAILL
jgi:hypothetical protein